MLTGKTIVLGVTGSIAAYKIANLASMLVKLHAEVHVIMTPNAARFIAPLTFETLTGRKCLVDTFDRHFSYEVEHVALAHKADVLVVAPATANAIGKFAGGICDDMLSTTYLACKAPKLIAPAMNTAMWESAVLQDNLRKLEGYGAEIITPASGRLACGDIGSGKLPAEDILLEHILRVVALPHDLTGRRVMVTAGPTRESLDPVRFITNHSSGKMGYAIAKIAAMRGAYITLVTGPVSLRPFVGIDTVQVTTAAEMFREVTSRSDAHDVIIMCSAVADYTPRTYSDRKIKKGDAPLTIEMERTQDILQYLGWHKAPRQFIVGFSMETENMLDNARTKLHGKGVDIICANSIASPDTGFGTDTNRVTLVMPRSEHQLPLCSKEETAGLILDAVVSEMAKRNA